MLKRITLRHPDCEPLVNWLFVEDIGNVVIKSQKENNLGVLWKPPIRKMKRPGEISQKSLILMGKSNWLVDRHSMICLDHICMLSTKADLEIVLMKTANVKWSFGDVSGEQNNNRMIRYKDLELQDLDQAS